MYAEATRPVLNAEPCASESLLVSLMGDLSEAIALSGDLSSSLYELRMNLFGPWPQKGTEAAAQPDPQSMEQRIALAVGRLRSNLLTAQEHGGVIRSRL